MAIRPKIEREKERKELYKWTDNWQTLYIMECYTDWGVWVICCCKGRGIGYCCCLVNGERERGWGCKTPTRSGKCLKKGTYI